MINVLDKKMENKIEEKWIVTYSDQTTDEYSAYMTPEQVCAYLNDTKQLVKIEKVSEKLL